MLDEDHYFVTTLLSRLQDIDPTTDGTRYARVTTSAGVETITSAPAFCSSACPP
jgi:hypothetical protein